MAKEHESCETIIALRARREAFQVANEVLLRRKAAGVSAINCAQCGNRFVVTGDGPDADLCTGCRIAAMVKTKGQKASARLSPAAKSAIRKTIVSLDRFDQQSLPICLVITGLWSLAYEMNGIDQAMHILRDFITPLEDVHFGVTHLRKPELAAMVGSIRTRLLAMLEEDTAKSPRRVLSAD